MSDREWGAETRKRLRPARPTIRNELRSDVHQSPEAGLPAWAARLIEELIANDQQAISLASGLTATQLNWRPREDTWSVGQCLHHLYVTNQVYLPPIEKALRGRRGKPVQEITPGWLGRWFIDNVIEPSPQSRKRRAPGKIVPAQRVEASILDDFLRSNVTVRDLVRKASAYDVNRIRFQNPFVPVIFFTVGTGLEVVSRHERRHLLQAERVTENPRFPQA